MTEEKRDDFQVSPRFSGWPFKSFKRFKQFAEQECGNCYWLAVHLLMERSEQLDTVKKALSAPPAPSSPHKEGPVTIGQARMGERKEHD